MTPQECLLGCQTKLSKGGFYHGALDGLLGPLTQQAWKDMCAAQGTGDIVLRGSHGWPWEAYVSGKDILIGPGKVTWFGGDSDPDDNGETMSGVDNHKYGVLGCALPVAWWVPSTKYSPLVFGRTSGPYKPSIPWKTEVEIRYAGNALVVPLIDNGPSQSSQKICDLTPAAFDYFGVPRTTNTGTLVGATVRILDAAQFVE